jgi:hypothetical protein
MKKLNKFILLYLLLWNKVSRDGRVVQSHSLNQVRKLGAARTLCVLCHVCGFDVVFVAQNYIESSRLLCQVESISLQSFSSLSNTVWYWNMYWPGYKTMHIHWLSLLTFIFRLLVQSIHFTIPFLHKLTVYRPSFINSSQHSLYIILVSYANWLPGTS